MEAKHQQILDADYSKVDLDAMVDELDISPGSIRKLKQSLKKFPMLFGGGLGLLDIPLVSIELQKDTKPFNGRYYSAPKAFETPFKKEINQMCETQVLRKLSHMMMTRLGLCQVLHNQRRPGTSRYSQTSGK